jgi:2-(1,2-epoxy-1,2-dihydrophenyl)acetyl-CoA isomerase
MEFKTIRYSVTGAVATLALNRPERLNALNAEVHADIRGALDQVEKNDALRCLVITGEGRAFCSGQDLTERVMSENTQVDTGASLDRDYNPLVRRLVTFPIPTIAAVNGPAVGAGANLALACDILLFARSAYFQEAFARIGLVPDAGGTWLLPRVVGLKRAIAMSMTAEQVSSEECLRLGLAYKVFEDATFQADVAKAAAMLAMGPTLAYRLMKRAFHESFGNDLNAQLDLERDLQREAGRSQDFREGVKAFLEKRMPRYQGM